MLKKLTILNGNMSLDFDPLNTLYTITLNEGAEELEFEVEASEEDHISIFKKENVEDIKEIVITVYNDEEMQSYYLTVYPATITTAITDSGLKNLEIKKEDGPPEYALPVIATICFLTILLFFTLLFKKSKKY